MFFLRSLRGGAMTRIRSATMVRWRQRKSTVAATTRHGCCVASFSVELWKLHFSTKIADQGLQGPAENARFRITDPVDKLSVKPQDAAQKDTWKDHLLHVDATGNTCLTLVLSTRTSCESTASRSKKLACRPSQRVPVAQRKEIFSSVHAKFVPS